MPIACSMFACMALEASRSICGVTLIVTEFPFCGWPPPVLPGAWCEVYGGYFDLSIHPSPGHLYTRSSTPRTVAGTSDLSRDPRWPPAPWPTGIPPIGLPPIEVVWGRTASAPNAPLGRSPTGRPPVAGSKALTGRVKLVAGIAAPLSDAPPLPTPPAPASAAESPLVAETAEAPGAAPALAPR